MKNKSETAEIIAQRIMDEVIAQTFGRPGKEEMEFFIEDIVRIVKQEMSQ